MGKRIYPLNLIKYWFCYDIDDICHLYGIHHQTVREWIRRGLKTINKKKPILIYGNDLKTFLGKQNQSNKHHIEYNQMFCMKCKDGKKVHKNQIHLESNNQFLKAKGLCITCKNIMNKSYKLMDLPNLKKIFVMIDMLQLYDCKNSPLKTHLEDQNKSCLNESKQIELF